MDRRERLDDLLVAVKSALDGRQSLMWTAMVGIVQSFNATKMTVTVQVAIREPVPQRDGTSQYEALPVLLDVPVQYPSGGGYVLTFPIAVGDEGLVVFSSRCIDAWWQNGGVQNQAELRMHDLSDGIFLPGLFSVPRVPTGVSTTKTQLRNAANTSRVELDATGKTSLVAGSSSLVVDPATNRVNIVAVGGLWVNGVQVTVP